MIYFTADTHLRHANILKHIPTRASAFANVDEMDTIFISECNRVVKPNDELRVIGDFIWGASWYGHYRAKLNVRSLHIVAGNHDEPSLAKYVSTYKDIDYVKINGIWMHLLHYPMLAWRGSNRQSIHLYGHMHATKEFLYDTYFPGRKCMDVGIDNAFRLLGEWRPFSIFEILDILKIPQHNK